MVLTYVKLGLTREDYRRWVELKRRLGCVSNKELLRKLLDIGEELAPLLIRHPDLLSRVRSRGYYSLADAIEDALRKDAF